MVIRPDMGDYDLKDYNNDKGGEEMAIDIKEAFTKETYEREEQESAVSLEKSDKDKNKGGIDMTNKEAQAILKKVKDEENELSMKKKESKNESDNSNLPQVLSGVPELLTQSSEEILSGLAPLYAEMKKISEKIIGDTQISELDENVGEILSDMSGFLSQLKEGAEELEQKTGFLTKIFGIADKKKIKRKETNNGVYASLKGKEQDYANAMVRIEAEIKDEREHVAQAKLILQELSEKLVQFHKAYEFIKARTSDFSTQNDKLDAVVFEEDRFRKFVQDTEINIYTVKESIAKMETKIEMKLTLLQTMKNLELQLFSNLATQMSILTDQLRTHKTLEMVDGLQNSLEELTKVTARVNKDMAIKTYETVNRPTLSSKTIKYTGQQFVDMINGIIKVRGNILLEHQEIQKMLTMAHDNIDKSMKAIGNELPNMPQITHNKKADEGIEE